MPGLGGLVRLEDTLGLDIIRLLYELCQAMVSKALEGVCGWWMDRRRGSVGCRVVERRI